MNLSAPEKLSARLYRDGTGVLYYSNHVHKDTHVNPIQKAERTFTIKKTQVRSSCLSCWSTKQSKFMLFVTFTFPFNPTEIQAQRIWKLMLDSLRNTYKVKNYVWVKELQKSGRIHYHILLDRNRLDIINVQNSWNNHIINICPRVNVSVNSVRLGNNPIVRTPKAVAQYLSKYIAKNDVEFKRRAWGTTVNKESCYKQIDVSDVLLSTYEQKNSGDVHYLFNRSCEILLESDAFIVFRKRDYYDVSP